MTTIENSSTELREKLRVKRLERLLAEQELATLRIKKSARILEGVGDVDRWVSIVSDRIDQFNASSDFEGGIGSLYNRSDGKNWPIYQNEAELNTLRLASRIMADTNAFAIGLLEGLTSYTIGRGFVYRFIAKSEQHKAIADQANKWREQFFAENQWVGGEQPSIEEEAFRRSIEDGEFLLLTTPQSEGRCSVRLLEPEQLTQPPNSTFEDWSFGVRSRSGDAQTPEAYWICWNTPTDGAEYPANQVTHYRSRARRAVKRGLPAFSFHTHKCLYHAQKLTEALGVGACIQASIAYIEQFAGGTAQQVSSYTDALSESLRVNPRSGKPYHQQRFLPGQILRTEEGRQFQPSPGYQSAGSLLEILNALLRSAGRPWCAPEWLASGDASNNNYASSLTAESPFVKHVQKTQGVLKTAFSQLIWYAWGQWIKANGLRLPGDPHVFSETELREILDLQVECPSVETRNRAEEASVNATYLNAKVKSAQTIQQELSLDPEREQRNIEEWEERHGNSASALAGLFGGAGGEQQ